MITNLFFCIQYCDGVLGQWGLVSKDNVTLEGVAVYSRGRHLEDIHSSCSRLEITARYENIPQRLEKC